VPISVNTVLVTPTAGNFDTANLSADVLIRSLDIEGGADSALLHLLLTAVQLSGVSMSCSLPRDNGDSASVCLA